MSCILLFSHDASLQLYPWSHIFWQYLIYGKLYSVNGGINIVGNHWLVDMMEPHFSAIHQWPCHSNICNINRVMILKSAEVFPNLKRDVAVLCEMCYKPVDRKNKDCWLCDEYVPMHYHCHYHVSVHVHCIHQE